MHRNYQGLLLLKATGNLSDRSRVRSELALNQVGEVVSYHGTPLHPNVQSGGQKKRRKIRQKDLDELLQNLKDLRSQQQVFRHQLLDLENLQNSHYRLLNKETADLLDKQMDIDEKLQDLADQQQQKDLHLREELSQFEQKRLQREEWTHYQSRQLSAALEEKLASLEQTYVAAGQRQEIFNKTWWANMSKVFVTATTYLVNSTSKTTSPTASKISATKNHRNKFFSLLILLHLTLLIVLWW